MNIYLGNAFSLQMLKAFPVSIDIVEVSAEEALSSYKTSVVGHQDTANVLGVPFNRISVALNKGDILYVAQVVGGRLPEGSTTLPEGFSMKFFKVTIA